MKLFTWGQNIDGIAYRVLNEREIRASSGIIMMIGAFAIVNGFVLRQFEVIPYLIGFIFINFLIAVLLNPRIAPTMLVARLFVHKQSPVYLGAIQKRFAYSLGSLLSGAIFILSLFLVQDKTLFEPVCFLCVICLFLLFSETVFGICIGCKLYFAAIKLRIIKQPEVTPNCMGDSCEIETN